MYHFINEYVYTDRQTYFRISPFLSSLVEFIACVITTKCVTRVSPSMTACTCLILPDVC